MAQPARTAGKGARKARGKAGVQEREATPALEWCSAGLGAALLVAAVSFLAWDAASGRDAPPELSVEAVAMRSVGDRFLVEIKVRNAGDRPAAQVEVEGELTTADGPETASATFDYVPAGSDRTGGLLFSQDPETRALTLSAKGYADP